MSRNDEAMILTGEIETVSEESAARAIAPSYGDSEGEEKTTFLSRPAAFARFAPPRPSASDERTIVDMPIPAPRKPVFDKEERTVVAHSSAPKPRASVPPPRPSTPAPAPQARAASPSTPLPPWSRPAEKPVLERPMFEVREQTSIAFPKQAKRIEEIREATSVAFPVPARLPAPSYTPAQVTASPAPAPRMNVGRVDTMSPVALDSTAALVTDSSPSDPTVMIAARGARAPSFFVAASLGMVAAIFVMGIAIGSFAFGRGETSSAASGSTASIAAVAKSAPKPVMMITSPAPVAPVAPAPAPVVATTTPAATPAPTPAIAAPVETPAAAPKHVAAAAPVHAWGAPAPQRAAQAPAPARVAFAAPSPAPAPKGKHAKVASEMDDATAADALAKAQLEASLR